MKRMGRRADLGWWIRGAGIGGIVRKQEGKSGRRCRAFKVAHCVPSQAGGHRHHTTYRTAGSVLSGSDGDGHPRMQRVTRKSSRVWKVDPDTVQHGGGESGDSPVHYD